MPLKLACLPEQFFVHLSPLTSFFIFLLYKRKIIVTTSFPNQRGHIKLGILQRSFSETDCLRLVHVRKLELLKPAPLTTFKDAIFDISESRSVVYLILLFTKSVDSNFRAFWLAPVTWNILRHSLVCQRREKWRVVSRKFQKKKLKKHFVSICFGK